MKHIFAWFAVLIPSAAVLTLLVWGVYSNFQKYGWEITLTVLGIAVFMGALFAPVLWAWCWGAEVLMNSKNDKETK